MQGITICTAYYKQGIFPLFNDKFSTIQEFLYFVCSKNFELKDFMNEVQYMIDDLENINKEITALQHKKEQENKTANWSFFDILYFTIVSLGLTNYSDISPNSTITRVSLTLQQLIGIYLLIYALNTKDEKRDQ